MKLKLDGLYILINENSGKPYPRLLTSKTEADELAKILGNTTVYPNIFINEE